MPPLPDVLLYSDLMRDMPNLDFVRSVAVISVVLEHTLLALKVYQVGPFPINALGVLGVFVFYVLTALVLMWSLERKPHTLDFYIRRFFRIYPLGIVCITLAILIHAPTAGTPSDLFQYVALSKHDIAGNLTLLQSPAHWAINVIWSLPYEVKMYILLPVLFFFVRKNFSLWPILIVWALVVANADAGNIQSHTFAVAIGYFLPGVMAYVGFGRWKPRLPGWMLPLFLLAMWAVFLPRFDFHRSAWAFCLILGLALPLFRQMTSTTVVAASRQIAKYSYGIYLTHSFGIVIGFYLLRGHSLPVRLAGELAPLIVFPVIAYHLVELPMIRLGSRLARQAEIRYEQHEMKRFRTSAPKTEAIRAAD